MDQVINQSLKPGLGKARGKRDSDGRLQGMDDFGDAPKKKGKTGGWQALGLDKPVLRSILAMGYKQPTPVQRNTLPLALAGRDIVCMSRTGSGKTAAFLVPLVQRLGGHAAGGARALILSPTRELAMQTLRFAKQMTRFSGATLCLLVGGDGLEQQFQSLSEAPDAIIATPGRLMHLLAEVPGFTLTQCSYVVFDEADRLFELGFAEQLRLILTQVPEARQTLLFSATMPRMLVQFARAGLHDPEVRGARAIPIPSPS